MKISKNQYLLLLLLFFNIFTISAQKKVNFAVHGGVFYANLDVSSTGVNVTEILTLLNKEEGALDVLEGGGFFIGFLADIKMLDDLSLQPELFYANAGGESIIAVPMIVKYYFAKSFNVQVGPQLDVVLDVPDDARELVDALGFSGAVGLGYDFNEKFALQTKYTFGITNRLDNDVTDFLSAIEPSLRTNTLQLGLVYKFK